MPGLSQRPALILWLFLCFSWVLEASSLCSCPRHAETGSDFNNRNNNSSSPSQLTSLFPKRTVVTIFDTI